MQADKPYGWLPLVKDKDVWPLQKHFNELLKFETRQLQAVFVDVDSNNFSDSDFVDQGHFSVSGSQKFAGKISETIRKECM